MAARLARARRRSVPLDRKSGTFPEFFGNPWHGGPSPRAAITTSGQSRIDVREPTSDEQATYWRQPSGVAQLQPGAGPGRRTQRHRGRQRQQLRQSKFGSQSPSSSSQSSIVITGRRLDIARDAITPSLGASQYTFDREALEKQPGGTNLTLNKSLLQAPGVVAGQLRRDPRPQRARQPSVPAERRHRAREHQRLRHHLRSADRKFDPADHRHAARAIRLSHRRRHQLQDPSPACSAMAARSASTAAASAGSSRAR